MKKRQYKYKTVRGLLADKSRWCKFAEDKINKDGTISYCILGAIQRTGNTNEVARRRIADAIRKFFPRASSHYDPTNIIIDFNDAPRRTHAQVLKVLKEAKI